MGYIMIGGYTIYIEVSQATDDKPQCYWGKGKEKKMTDREMEDMLDEIFRKVFKEDW